MDPSSFEAAPGLPRVKKEIKSEPESDFMYFSDHRPTSTLPPSGPTMYLCSKCHKAINEPMLSFCDNKYWHSTCLTCHVCGLMGGSSLYSHCGLLLCKDDYMKINSTCKGCQRPFNRTDMAIHAKNYGYLHEKCLFCFRCRCRFEIGDRYMVTVNQGVICPKCVNLSNSNSTNNTNGAMPAMVANNNTSYMMCPGGPNGPGPGSVMMPVNGFNNGGLNGQHQQQLHHLNHHGPPPQMHGGAANVMPVLPPPPQPQPATTTKRGRKRGGGSNAGNRNS